MQINSISQSQQSFGTGLNLPKYAKFNQKQQKMIQAIKHDLNHYMYGRNGLIFDTLEKNTDCDIFIQPQAKGIKVSLIDDDTIIGAFTPVDKNGKKIEAKITSLKNTLPDFSKFMTKCKEYATGMLGNQPERNARENQIYARMEKLLEKGKYDAAESVVDVMRKPMPETRTILGL